MGMTHTENKTANKEGAAPKIPTQAEAVIALFGGAAILAAAVGKNESTVYRWTYSAADGGTDGIIPARALRAVLAAAAQRGILITAADLYPTAR
jgi:hypothetical protein